MFNIKVIYSILLLTALILTSCGRRADDSGKTQTDASTDTAESVPVSIAGVIFTPLAKWVDLGPSGMRKASYYSNPIGDDADSATITVFYFGPSGGGTIQGNLERWISQMKQPDGGDPHNVSEMTELKVDDMTAHVLELPGVYMAGGMMGTPVEKSDYFMVGVVLEAPEGNLFFKLTGPEKTAKSMADELIEMVKAVKKN